MQIKRNAYLEQLKIRKENGVDREHIIEFRAESGRFYRYDGIGNVTKAEMEDFDLGAEFVDYYDSLNA